MIELSRVCVDTDFIHEVHTSELHCFTCRTHASGLEFGSRRAGKSKSYRIFDQKVPETKEEEKQEIQKLLPNRLHIQLERQPIPAPHLRQAREDNLVAQEVAPLHALDALLLELRAQRPAATRERHADLVDVPF